jgi:hypothetical protein
MPSTIRFALFLCIGYLGLHTFGCAPPAPVSKPTPPNTAAAKDDHDHGKDGHDDHDHDHKDGDHDHDHDKHAEAGEEKHSETYADAVNEIEALRKSIKENFDAKKLAEADTAVHEVGHVLEAVTKLAEKAALSPEDQAEVKKNVEALFDAFGKIDDRLHSNDAAKGSDYNGVAKELEAALDVLKSKVKTEETKKSDEGAKASEEKSEPETPAATEEKTEAEKKDESTDKEAAEKAAADK